MARSSASAKAGTSPCATSRPYPALGTISAFPPTLVATTGVPQASASRSTLAQPSDRVARQKTSAAEYHSGSASCGLRPAHRTPPAPEAGARDACAQTFHIAGATVLAHHDVDRVGTSGRQARQCLDH